jgi:hypothetical protein
MVRLGLYFAEAAEARMKEVKRAAAKQRIKDTAEGAAQD